MNIYQDAENIPENAIYFLQRYIHISRLDLNALKMHVVFSGVSGNNIKDT